MAKKSKNKKKTGKNSESLESMPNKAQKQEKKVNADKSQLEKDNKLLLQIFIIISLVLILFFGTYLFIQSKKTFEYKGVKFNIEKIGNLTFYTTQIPIYSKEGNSVLDYNFYLRTDPRELDKMEFDETIQPLKLVALNYSNNLDCRGYGMIAFRNLINLYELIGAKITIDKNATCDEEGKYMFWNIQSADETSLKKTGISCYEFNVKDCEVFPPTEKFMLETFVKIKNGNIRVTASSAG